MPWSIVVYNDRYYAYFIDSINFGWIKVYRTTSPKLHVAILSLHTEYGQGRTISAGGVRGRSSKADQGHSLLASITSGVGSAGGREGGGGQSPPLFMMGGPDPPIVLICKLHLMSLRHPNLKIK